MLYFSIFLFLFVFTVAFLIFNKIHVHTSTMAAVMALGIITQGVLFNFFGLHAFEKVLTVINLAMWSTFSFSFFMTFLNKKFREIHYSNPINRFGMGTWVAGTSICAILISKQISEWAFIARLLSYLNFGLWILYIGISIRAFFDLYRNRLTKKVHGILLLTTVSTQSIVLLMSAVYKKVPITIDHFFIAVGICFYIISSFVILNRYFKRTDSWSIETDWNNTNCILHGALSITGLACIKTNAASEHTIIIIWICAATVFMIVEFLEVYRLYKRIKGYGIKNGILIYDVSQWSRIFTFGMFYTFTYLIAPKLSFISGIQNMIITIGIWAILFLLIIECVLCCNFLFQTYRKYPYQNQTTGDKINSPL